MSARRSPTLVVLGGGPAQRHAIDAARAMGVRTVVCDGDPRVADVHVSTEDLDGVREVARSADGIIAPGTDWPVRIAAEAAHDLGLPHPISVATARICTDKLAQRALLGTAGVLQPEWSADAPPGYPCVIKAPDRQGQRAMAIVHDPSQVDPAADRARAAARNHQVLFERYVPGPEVTVDGFLKDGRNHIVAVTDRVHFPDAPGIAKEHVYPSAYPESVEAAAETATAALAALGVESGPTYVQLILGPDGPCVIEVAARLGGGHDSELLKHTVGVDLASAAVRAALGWEVAEADLTPHPNGAGVIEFLRAPEGELVAADGPPHVHFYHAHGHTYGPLVAAAVRAGYVLETGSSRREAVDRAEAALEHISFEVK